MNDELLDVVVDGPPFADAGDDGGKVVIGQDDGCGLTRDLRSAASHRCAADVRLMQRRGVIHAIARHGDNVPAALEGVDDAQFLLGGRARKDADAGAALPQFIIGRW